jgi:CSLREA domain-containing protein
MRACSLLVALAFLLAGADAATAAEYTVNSTGDQTDQAPGSNGCKTTVDTCTLRAAIEESNASPGVADTIEFADSFDGQLGHTIELATSLPTITNRVTLKGFPQPLKCETDYFSFLGPCVGISGPPAGTAFRVAAEKVRIIGFAIADAKTAVEVVGGPGLEVWNNWFGLKLDGSAGGLETGIAIDQNSNGPLIGLSTNAGNIFAHSANAGLEIHGADFATVSGNGFGVLPDGNSLAANGNNIEIADAASGENRVAHGNWIGGTYSKEDPASTICDVWCNVISGAAEAGIDLSGSGPDQEPASGSTRIFANYIGLNAFGTAGIPNVQQAIRVGAAGNVTIGGPREIDRNLINGGVSAVLSQPYAANLRVENNWIGLDATGELMLAPPSSAGIAVGDGSQVQIAGNRIAMAEGAAIKQGAREAVVRGNTIGKGVGGQDLPGGTIGIQLEGWCGICDLVEDNVVANASEHGLSVGAPSTKIFGNRIEGSGAAGILVYSSSPFGAAWNEIGGDSAERENAISRSGGAAIEIRDDAPFGSVIGNTVGRNHGAMNGGSFISLVEGTNRGIPPPAVSTATPDGAAGQGAEPEATIRVFRKADASPGEIEGFLAEAVADEDGNWAVVYPGPIPGGIIVAASQTDTEGGTSEFAFSATTAEPDSGAGEGDADGGGTPEQAPAEAPAPTPPAAIALIRGKVLVKGGNVLARVACRRGVCSGVLKIFARLPLESTREARNGKRVVSRRARFVLIGKRRFRVADGARKVLRVRLNRRGRALVRRAGRRGLKVRLSGKGVRNHVVRLRQSGGKAKRRRLSAGKLE